MSARPTPLDVIRRGLDDSAIFGTEGAAASIVKALTEAGHLLPPWVASDGHGRRYLIIPPAGFTPPGVPLDQLLPEARIQLISDSDGNPLPPGDGGGAT
jgi:hypothetical protein